GLFLSLQLKKQMKDALDQFERWGVKGFMVDFVDRDDQVMVNFYELVLKEAAKRKLFVNFHGAFKPTGLQRKYPNQLTREAVLGHEFNMWSDRVTPDHTLTIPFIRMLAGPMDYEGGSMQNAQKKDFRSIFEKPMSQGTRTQQLAQYVVYISPLQYLAGNPSDYLREPEFTELLASVPTTWDETVVIEGKISDYLVIARKHNNEWFVAAMTDWDKRSLEIDLSFLDHKDYESVICRDGINADKYASDYKIEKLNISSDDKIKIELAPGGGWFARLTPVK
ncbi:glycoside hydrolase family 97 protein, partial [bacterium]